MTTETITYHSANAKPELAWMAYVVMPNGKLWMVPSFGATENDAVKKIVALWENERAKVIIAPRIDAFNPAPMKLDPWAEAKHHRAGKIWMRHKETRELVSIPLTEITMYEGKGYERSGPRSK